MKAKLFFCCFFFFSFYFLKAQNSIAIKATLDAKNDVLKIQQKTIFFNKSNDTLSSIFLHNWANSFKNNKTPLGKRFLEDYKKDFYFSKGKERGNSKIYNITTNNQQALFKEVKNQPDVIKINLRKALLPNDSIKINTTYAVKIPDAKFTGYGKTKTGYHLRFWYLTPAVYKNGWQTMSNLNLDDLYQDIANFTIDIDVPKKFIVESNLYQHKTKKENSTNYYLVGKDKKDVIIHIDTSKHFKSFQTKNTQVKTDIFNKKIDFNEAKKIISREINFIENYIGKNPHIEILVDANTVNKNTIHEIYGLPRWLKPYPENFRWEMRFFKALTSKYIDDVLLLNQRKDYWLSNGIQTFLMMEYLKKYYPDVTVLGKFSKVWGIRNYNLAKLKQSDKFAHLYQFSARRFYDQPLTMRSDSLSNFNRKIISQYKAGLGFKYLQDFVGDSILKVAFRTFYKQQKLKITDSKTFENILKKKTSKNIDWFFGDFVQTNKKIDYTIKKVTQKTDSIEVTIKNKRNITAPVALYGVKKKEISFKKWINNIDSVETISIPKGNYDKLALNYEQIYPEYNSLDNFRTIDNKLLNKPLQFRFYKDVEDPYYNQIYYQPNIKYNYYDGVILALKLHNKPIIAHNLKLNVSPSYATKSNSLTGSFGISYDSFGKPNSNIYKTIYGLSGSYSHYDKNLAYRTFNPFVQIEFKRNSLRDVGSKFLGFSLITINKDPSAEKLVEDQDNYTVFGAKYFNSKPNVIKGLQYAVGTEFSNKFSKLTSEIRYRKLTSLHSRMELRAFAGVFLYNKTKDNYFSFGLDRANDYLFQLNYFGRSEKSGIFSQQFILTEGGFKSKLDTRFANQFIVSFNSSIGIWRWAEVYNDLAFLKNKNRGIYTGYENGIRLNFIPNIFELYFPMYSNNGWEVSQEAYPKKIRFVLTANLDAIYNFIRRGIL